MCREDLRFFNFTKHRTLNEKGIAMVEMTIALPLFLLFAFTIVALAFLFNAKSALRTATERAVLLGITRGATEYLGMEIITEINQYKAGDDSGRIRELLSNKVTWGSDTDEYYELRAGEPTTPDREVGWVFKCPLDEMPAEYIYTLIYTYETTRISLGDTVRYPCNPNDMSDGAGCLRCVFLNPVSVTTDIKYSESNPDYSSPPCPQFSMDEVAPPRRHLGIECEYQPDNIFIKPALSLMQYFTGKDQNPFLIREKFLVKLP